MIKKKKRVTLDRGVYAKPLRWAIDQDYAHKLADDEKDWMAKFLSEYYENGFKKDDPERLHKRRERDCYQRNNAMRRDLFSLADARFALVRDPDDIEYNPEEDLIEYLDRKHGPKLRIIKNQGD